MNQRVPVILFALLAFGSESSFGQAENALTREQQASVDTAVAYFEGGGAWTFRFAPSSASAVESKAGPAAILRSARSKQLRYTLGSFQFDTPPKDPNQMVEVIATVPAVLGDSKMREAFVARFAKGIDAGRLQAYLVNRLPVPDEEPFSLAEATLLKAPAFIKLFRSPSKE